MTTKTRLSATFIGGPTLHFSYAGRTFLTDPTFDPPQEYGSGDLVLRKLTGPALPAADLEAVDVVLLSHDQHPDNLDRSGRDLLATVSTTLSTTSAAERVPGVVGLTPWQTHRLPGTAGPEILVTAVPALHGPPGCEAVSGQVIGFVLRADGWPTVYVSGDNASVDVLSVIVKAFPDIAVAVLFVGAANVGRFGAYDVTLGSRDAAVIAALLADAVVVPVHAEDWGHFTEPLSAFESAYGAAGGALLALPRGERVELLSS